MSEYRDLIIDKLTGFVKIPYAGMDCTYRVGTDYYGATVRKVLNEKRIVITKDVAPEEQLIFTLRKNDRWAGKGKRMNKYQDIVLGFKRNYGDPDF